MNSCLFILASTALKCAPRPIERDPPETPFRVAMYRVCHYNAHAIRRLAWNHNYHKRHPPPVSPMDVAFLVPEA